MLRSTWTYLSDSELLSQCSVDTYRASGPGGQKRNKTSSAVRLRHQPSNLIVIAEESRSQHENKAKALQRLRRTLFIALREPADAKRPEIQAIQNAESRLVIASIKDERFWPAVAVLLDLLESSQGQVSKIAELLSTTTANVISILELEKHVWQEANRIRAIFGLKLLKMD